MADAPPQPETAAPNDSDDSPQDVKIEDAGPALKRLTITIPADAVHEKIEESIGALATSAALPGFRPGKVPRKLLEKRFGMSVRDETKNRLIADAYARAIQDNEIQPVGEPEPMQKPDEITLEEGKPLEFSVEVEVVPSFDLPDLDGIPIRKPLLEIADEHVEDRVTRQQFRLGDVKRIEDGFEGGDRLGGQVTVVKEGEAEPLVENEEGIILYPEEDKGPVLGFMIDDLAKRLKGKRVGDTLEFEIVGPESHEREDIRGAKLTITFRVTAAERPVPLTVEQLVEAFGVGSEDNLREQMRMALEHQRDQEQANAMREQVYTYLLDAVDIELPEKMSAMQASRALEGMRLQLLERGLSPEEAEARIAEHRGDSVTEARNRLKLFFLLRRLGEHYKINVTEQEINGRIATIAAQNGQRPDQLRTELQRTGRINEVARIVYEQKAADRVVATAKIEEIEADKWNEQVGSGGTTTKKKTSKKTTTKKKTSKKKTTKK